MELMNQDYPEELVYCQNCNRIKKVTTLLECFHNICQDCEQENEHLTCRSCPQNKQIPRDGLNHQLNALLYEHLTKQGPLDPETKKCTMCGTLENTVYCTDCGTFWCEAGIEELHNNIIARGFKHVMKRDVTQFDLHLMPKGDGDHEDEAEWNAILEDFETMGLKGRTDQTDLIRKRNNLEEWKTREETEVGSLFDKIIDNLVIAKKDFIQELNNKSDNMQEELEEIMNRNEMKLITLERANQLVTKMQFHKLTSEPMKQFLTDRNITKGTYTYQVGPVITHVNKQPLEDLERLALNANVTIQIPSLKTSTIDVEPTDQNRIQVNVCLKNKLDQTICGKPNTDVSVQVKRDGNVVERSLKVITSYPNHYAHYTPKDSGNYEFRLKIDKSLVLQSGQFQEFQQNATQHESVTPLTKRIAEEGLHRGVTTSPDNSLYCVVKDPPEIRRYCVFLPLPPDLTSPCERGSGKISIPLDYSFGQGQLGSPCGICYLDAHLYVADAGLNCVHIFTNNGEYIEKFGGKGSKPGQFQRPMGIDYDHWRQEILIADTFNNRIQSCMNAGDTRVFNCFGTNEQFKLKDPVDVKSFKNGNTVVTTLKAQIILYDLERNFSRVIISEILTPRHCCIDSEDNILVTSHLGHSVFKLVQTADGTNAFGKIKLKAHPEFRFPTGIATNKDGKLFVISRELNPESTKSYVSVW